MTYWLRIHDTSFLCDLSKYLPAQTGPATDFIGVGKSFHHSSVNIAGMIFSVIFYFW